MKNVIILPLLLLFSYSLNVYGQTSSPKSYLDEVFQIIEEHSIRRDSVDFQKIKSTAYEKLKNTQSIEACYPIIKSVLADLNDQHSFFLTSKQAAEWQSPIENQRVDDVITFSGRVLNNEVGYIQMKGFSNGDSVSVQNYADSLQELIRSIDDQNIKGWILDLRQNVGGNCWPMLAGIGPLLDDGICGYFVDNDRNTYSWFYKNGEAGINSLTAAKVSGKPYRLLNSDPPIAVLTGYQTASSGEVVVTAFRHKSNTKSFGESTAGLTTGNGGYELSDSSVIWLTTTIYADRQENLYGKKIIPDELVKFSYQKIGTTSDPVIKAAINWIYKN